MTIDPETRHLLWEVSSKSNLAVDLDTLKFVKINKERRKVRIIRPKEAAKMLGVSTSTLYRWEAEGKIAPRVKLGPGVSGWLDTDIEEFVENSPRVEVSK